jgi:NTP pyrophosphatase (non-canonical NTP hydrolase)
MNFTTQIFIEDIGFEVERVRKKFPNSRRSFAALVEEVGELAQALLHVLEKPNDMNRTRIREEAIQVAAMACRVATEGDSSLTEP